MYADGSGQTRITNDPASDDNPAWSPDGQQIAFASNRGGAPDVYVMTAGGASPKPLTSASASSFNDAPVKVRNGASVL